jgi:hypothetical protein
MQSGEERSARTRTDDLPAGGTAHPLMSNGKIGQSQKYVEMSNLILIFPKITYCLLALSFLPFSLYLFKQNFKEKWKV